MMHHYVIAPTATMAEAHARAAEWREDGWTYLPPQSDVRGRVFDRTVCDITVVEPDFYPTLESEQRELRDAWATLAAVRKEARRGGHFVHAVGARPGDQGPRIA